MYMCRIGFAFVSKIFLLDLGIVSDGMGFFVFILDRNKIFAEIIFT